MYEAIRRGPKWEETLFIITYDEHGGFFDHVTPPRNVPAPDEHVADNGFKFDQLGIRLPTIAISPYIKRGSIIHDALPHEQPSPSSKFDSTSIMATSNLLLGLHDAEPLGKRMAWANTFAGLVLDKQLRTDCVLTLPALPGREPGAYLEQRAKPINDHLESQILFYCAMNHREQFLGGSCNPLALSLQNQGDTSDWLSIEAKLWQDTLREREKKQKLGHMFSTNL